MPKWTHEEYTNYLSRIAGRKKPAVDKIDHDNYRKGVELIAKMIWDAYQKSASIHKAAKGFGVCGETARKILLRNGYRLNRSSWTEQECETLKNAYLNPPVDTENLSRTIRRPLDAIYLKANELGVTSERGKFIRSDATLHKCSLSQKVAQGTPEARKLASEKFKKWHCNNAHPRGMAGKHHSKEAREAISKYHKGRSRPREQVLRQMKTTVERYGRIAPAHKRGSWKAEWVEIGGQRFFARSRWEANYGRYLQWLVSLGEVVAWEHEPHCFWFEGIKRGVCSYLPDFKVTYSNRHEWHEVKGWMDPRSATKLKRMKKYFPAETVRVIDGAWFKDANLKVGNIVPGWESISRKPHAKPVIFQTIPSATFNSVFPKKRSRTKTKKQPSSVLSHYHD